MKKAAERASQLSKNFVPIGRIVMTAIVAMAASGIVAGAVFAIESLFASSSPQVEVTRSEQYTGARIGYDQDIFAFPIKEEAKTVLSSERNELMLTSFEVAEKSAYSALYNELKLAVETYGMGFQPSGVAGMAFAELIDFNNDGIPELIYAVWNEGGRDATVFVVGYHGGSVVQMYKGESHFASWHDGPHEIKIAECKYGSKYFVTGKTDFEAGQSTYNYFVYGAGMWYSVLNLFSNITYESYTHDGSHFYERVNHHEWYVDREAVSEEEYKNASGKWREITSYREITRNSHGVDTVIEAIAELKFLSSVPSDFDHIIIAGQRFSTSLTELDLSGAGLGNDDIVPLQQMVHLHVLNLGENQISDLTPLSGLRSLTDLDLGNNQISDLSPLSRIMSLKTLNLSQNDICDLLPLIRLTDIESLDVSQNQISDLIPLSHLKNLQKLSISGGTSDLSPLFGLRNLNWLYLDNNEISDLSPLSGLVNLNWLHLANNEISDLSPLSGLTNLNWLHLANNRISDLQPLSQLAKLEYLHLDGNRIDDISPLDGLANVRNLRLFGNPIAEWTPVENLSAPPDEVVESVYSAYYDLLSDVVDRRGFSSETGMHTAKLIDFDNDGVPELIYAVRTHWTAVTVHVVSYSEGLNPLITWDFTNQYWHDGPSDALIACAGDKYYFVASTTGYDSRHSEYYTVIEGQWVMVFSSSTSFYIEYPPDSYCGGGMLKYNEWYVNDMPVSEREFGRASERELGITCYHGIGCWSHGYENVIETLAELRFTMRQPAEKEPESTQAVDYVTIAGQRFSTALTELDLSGVGLTNADIVPLKYMTQLSVLDLGDNKISDLRPLSGLTGLKVLDLRDNQISDLTPLLRLKSLESLNVSGNQLSDLIPLSHLVNLRKLDLASNRISDIMPLSGLWNLEFLYLANNELSNMWYLTECWGLKHLELQNNQIRTVNLWGLSDLEYLNLAHNQIVELPGFTIDYKSLKYLNIDGNRIKDLFALSNATNLRSLRAFGNPISTWPTI